MYIHGNRFKDAIDSEIVHLNYELDLLLSLGSIAKERLKEISKVTKSEMDSLDQLDISQREAIENKELEQKVYNDFFIHTFHTPYIIIHSLLVSEYSAFEAGLFNVSFRLESYCTSEVKIKDITKERGEIDRCRKYINLVHKIPSASSQNSHWKKILIFQRIRNLIVHNSSTFKKDGTTPSLIEFLNKYDTHIVRDHFFKIHDEKFLLDFKDSVMNFCNDIFKDILKIKVEN